MSYTVTAVLYGCQCEKQLLHCDSDSEPQPEFAQLGGDVGVNSSCSLSFYSSSCYTHPSLFLISSPVLSLSQPAGQLRVSLRAGLQVVPKVCCLTVTVTF